LSYLRFVWPLLLSGCAAVTVPPDGVPSNRVAPFSANSVDAELPVGWQPWIITRAKKPTVYDLVRSPEGGRVVLHAIADGSASGLMQPLTIDPAEFPIIAWQWRVIDLIVGADNQDRYSDDSPLRLMLFFDGDRTTLPFREQMLMETAGLLTGQKVPFATLVYVWENRFPVGTVLPNAHTQQVKLVVAGSGRDRLGAWHSFERNFVKDYRRAFGSEPGRLAGVGIMTDTDNTGESIEAFYGDIVLRRR
jgi:hypothetical protein